MRFSSFGDFQLKEILIGCIRPLLD
jgi:hypothetical protein